MEKKISPCPCPFCGHTVSMTRSPFMGTFAFVCRGCGADVMFYGAEDDEEAALKKWNRRADNA